MHRRDGKRRVYHGSSETSRNTIPISCNFCLLELCDSTYNVTPQSAVTVEDKKACEVWQTDCDDTFVFERSLKCVPFCLLH